MKKRDNVSIGDIYGKMLNGVKHNIKESKTAFGDFKEEKKKKPDGYNDALDDDADVCEEEDEETEDDIKPTKRQQTTKDLQDRLKDPKLSTEAKKKIKLQIDSRTAEESEEEESLKESKKIVGNW